MDEAIDRSFSPLDLAKRPLARYHYAMGWYRVIKTIKGHRYVYEQRTRVPGEAFSRRVGPRLSVNRCPFYGVPPCCG